MKHALYTLLVTFLTTSSAYAVTDFVQIVPHAGICNEVRIVADEDGSTAWQEKSGGGRFSSATASFQELQRNELKEISFGKPCLKPDVFGKCADVSPVTMHFAGPALVTTSLPPGRAFSVSFSNLYDRTDTIFGKAEILYEADASKWINDPSANYGKRMKILFGALYVNAKHDAKNRDVKCKYVSADVNLGDLRSGQCIWIDDNSRASNGLPYCW